ncbi:MAG: SpoIIE family protein phosphatase [Leptospira sp.]|nr:SpoIIE family protein phosphatase [Leptospira sp.]
MDFSQLSLDNILFNYYSFGNLLALLITFLLGIFFLSLKDKTTSTLHLGIGCLLLSMFQLGYFLAAFIYHPIASYHRWLTGGFILPAILHLGQFMWRWPGNQNKKTANIILLSGWVISFVTVTAFIIVTSMADTKYHFTAHHWDFNSEDASKYLGLMIALFSFINFLILPVIRIILHLKGRKRLIMVAYLISFLIAAVIPNVFNVLSRDGIMERSTYLTSLVILFYFAFFLITIIFINTSVEKTTFMIKIVGISLVTVMLMLEQLALIYDQEKEDQYNRISLATIEKSIASKDYNDTGISFVLSSLPDSSGLSYPKYNQDLRLDLPMVKVDMENSRIYEELTRLEGKNFKNRTLAILSKTPDHFSGYKSDIISFLESNENLQDSDLKESLTKYYDKLNKQTFIASNKLSDIDDEVFCKRAISYLNSEKKLVHFMNQLSSRMEDCNWDGRVVESSELKANVLKHFRYFKKTQTRHYRKNLDNNQHFIAYMVYNPASKEIIEAGLPYVHYRIEMNRSSVKEMGLMLFALFILLFAFPLFFKLSLINPLNDLTSGVTQVNEGDLDVKVPIQVNDEIGFLAGSFNGMVASIKDARRQLEDYAENLELKVQERTKEVQDKMEEIQKLKVQQDGDYFLTSLLAKPLYYNANKSDFIKTDFFVHQKKQFEFRKKTGDLGGDISVTGNLKLGKPDNFRRYTVAVNGDAMGKSMQGAGGSLVMGVVMNSIMARSAGNKRILNRTPEEWLIDVYEETNSVFKSFNGTMVISATIFMIDEETGECWYFNAEHPFTVLYRDGKASFIEKELLLRKLGLDSEIPFEVKKYQLLPGDTLIFGTDGRDDIDLTPNEPFRTINEDEEIFLKHVEDAKGDIYEIEKILLEKGELTDDLSLMRLDFQHDKANKLIDTDQGIAALESEHAELEGTAGDTFQPTEEETWEKKFTTEGAYQEGRNLYKSGDIHSAIDLMFKAYSNDSQDPKLNKLLSLLTFKGRDYDKAVEVLDVYLKQDPDASEFWYYLSVAKKKLGDYQDALDAGLKSHNLNSESLSNTINIADLYRLLGKIPESKEFAEIAEKMDPDNANVKKLYQLLEKIV